jgi:hypothetical protein
VTAPDRLFSFAIGKSDAPVLPSLRYDDRECIWLEYGAWLRWCRLGSQHLAMLLSMMWILATFLLHL